MSFSRIETVYTYKTSLGNQNYQYDIVVDLNGKVNVRNIRGPKGLIADSRTALPLDVMKDIQDAISVVSSLQSSISVYTSTIEFDGVSSKTVSLPEGTVNTDAYHVSFTTPDGVHLNSEELEVTGFVAVAPFDYGTEDEPIEVDYSILVNVLPTTEYSGTVTFNSDSSSQTITFSSPLQTSKYHVLFSSSGFYPISISNKTKNGFTVVIGYSLPVGETTTVYYDIVL